MKKLIGIILILLLILLVSPTYVSAHPGRTDGSGGHTCRTNCPDWGLSYGQYHYHNAPPPPPPPPPEPEPIPQVKQEPVIVPKAVEEPKVVPEEDSGEVKGEKEETQKEIKEETLPVTTENNKQETVSVATSEQEEATTFEMIIGLAVFLGMGFGVFKLGQWIIRRAKTNG